MIDPDNMRMVFEAMHKAGWIKQGRIKTDGESCAQTFILPSDAGAERFRAILFLMRELQPALGTLTPENMGWVCEYATQFAPNKESLAWPSQLSDPQPRRR